MRDGRGAKGGGGPGGQQGLGGRGQGGTGGTPTDGGNFRRPGNALGKFEDGYVVGWVAVDRGCPQPEYSFHIFEKKIYI